MRHKNTDIVQWIILSVVGVVILGFLINKMFIYVNTTSDATDKIVDKAQEQIYDYIDSELAQYDGEKVRGYGVRNLIKEQLGNYSITESAPIYVKVTTVVSGITYNNLYQNSQYISNMKDFTSTQYFINPTAWFKTTVAKSANQAILGVTFVQQ